MTPLVAAHSKLAVAVLIAGNSNVLIIGELDDGEFWISSAANAGEALVLMERAKHKIVFGDD